MEKVFYKLLIYISIITVFAISVHNCITTTNRFLHYKRTFRSSSGDSIQPQSSPLSSSSRDSHERKRYKNLTAIRSIALANMHLIEIRKHRCGVPRPKLVRVKDYYNAPSKDYIPRCTSLYRCDDESGCCEDSSMQCAPQETEEVQLYFYVKTIDNNEGDHLGVRRLPSRSTYVEVLTFVNHTKCKCEEINYRPRSHVVSKPTHLNTIPDLTPAYFDENDENDENDEYDESDESDDSEETDATHRQQLDVCKRVECPSPFTRKETSDYRCVCDCYDHDSDCLRIKNGREKLSPMEARCVRGGECLEPECILGGTFNRQDGSCVIPKQPNKYPHHALRHQHHQRTHWLSERD